MTVRFGILGAGNIARKLAAAVGACEEAELAAVAARDLSRAESFCRENGGRKAYGSYDELLNDPEIDVVYIALPNKLHMPYAIQAMEHGKAVLSEKPFAATRAEAVEGVEAARRTGALFMEAMWTRWLPPVQQAKRWLDEGRIGKPLLADLRLHLCRGSHAPRSALPSRTRRRFPHGCGLLLPEHDSVFCRGKAGKGLRRAENGSARRG